MVSPSLEPGQVLKTVGNVYELGAESPLGTANGLSCNDWHIMCFIFVDGEEGLGVARLAATLTPASDPN